MKFEASLWLEKTLIRFPIQCSKILRTLLDFHKYNMFCFFHWYFIWEIKDMIHWFFFQDKALILVAIILFKQWYSNFLPFILKVANYKVWKKLVLIQRQTHLYCLKELTLKMILRWTSEFTNLFSSLSSILNIP
jgi:hypothetical protein